MTRRKYLVVDDNAEFVFPGTPMLVVTAYRDFEAEGGQEIFRKPFDTAKLVARIEALAQKAGVA